MQREYELMEAMRSYVDGVDMKIRRIHRRVRNEADESTGEVFDLLNRKLVLPEQVEALSKSLWSLVVSVNSAFDDVSYWNANVKEMAGRVHYYDEDDEEAGRTEA